MRVELIEIERVWTAGPWPDVGGGLEDGYPPIIVGEPDDDGEYELVDGYHRLSAAEADGRRKIWAIIVTIDELARMDLMSESDWIQWVQSEAEALED